jgi:hypothetical protein
MIVGVPGPKTAPLTAFHIEADSQILTALGDLLWRPVKVDTIAAF